MGPHIYFLCMLCFFDTPYLVRILVCNLCMDLLEIQLGKYKYHLGTVHLDHKVTDHMDHLLLVL